MNSEVDTTTLAQQKMEMELKGPAFTLSSLNCRLELTNKEAIEKNISNHTFDPKSLHVLRDL